MEHYAGRVVFLYEMKHYMLGPVASVGEEGRGQTPFILRLKCGRRNKKIGDAKKGRKERKWGGRGGKEKEKGRETEKGGGRVTSQRKIETILTFAPELTMLATYMG